MSTNSALSTSLTDSQRYVLALVRTVSGSCSLLCSSIIIYKIYLRNKQQKAAAAHVQESRRSITTKRAANTYYRMLWMTSVIDIMYSFWCALSVLPVPKETGGVFAYGNVATCCTQAFFVQAGHTIVLYMATLNVYFMLKIRYNIPDVVIERRYEIWLHAIPVGIWLISGVAGFSLKIFGPLPLPEMGCWIGPFPQGCLRTNSCILGSQLHDHRDLIVWTFSYMWLFLCFFIVLVNSILVYSTIHNQERRNEQYLATRILKQGASSAMMKSSTIQPSVRHLSLPDFDFLHSDESFVKSHSKRNHVSPTLPIVDEKQESPRCDEAERTAADSLVACEHPGAPSPPLHLDGTKTTEVSQASFQRHMNARRIKQSRTAAVQSTCYTLSALFAAVWTFLPWVGYKWNLDVAVRFSLPSWQTSLTRNF